MQQTSKAQQTSVHSPTSKKQGSFLLKNGSDLLDSKIVQVKSHVRNDVTLVSSHPCTIITNETQPAKAATAKVDMKPCRKCNNTNWSSAERERERERE